MTDLHVKLQLPTIIQEIKVTLLIKISSTAHKHVSYCCISWCTSCFPSWSPCPGLDGRFLLLEQAHRRNPCHTWQRMMHTHWDCKSFHGKGYCMKASNLPETNLLITSKSQMLLLVSEKKINNFPCCIALAACQGATQKTGLRTVRQQSLSWPGLTPSVTSLETVPAQATRPQTSTLRTHPAKQLRSDLQKPKHAAWPQPCCRDFPDEPQRTARSFTFTKPQWEAWSQSGFAPFPSQQSRTTHHAEMPGRDWHTQTHGDHRSTWGEQEAGHHTHTLCSGVYTQW